jgi:hypothetical protein
MICIHPLDFNIYRASLSGSERGKRLMYIYVVLVVAGGECPRVVGYGTVTMLPITTACRKASV